MADKDEMSLPEAVECITPSLPAVTAQEKELASTAQTEFDRGAYGQCLTILNKLNVTRQSDSKVSHNMALAEYCHSGFKNTDEFRNKLSAVCIQSQVSLDDVESLDDVDQCVIFYNQSVTLYFLRQYNTALYIMDKLFQFIEPMEESLARKVMFFLVELYLCTHQPDKAMGMLGFLEKTLFGNGGKQTPDRDKEAMKDEDLSLKAQQNEVYRPRISQYKVRCYIMLKSMKSCKREMKNLMTSQNKVTLPLIYLKSDFEYLRGNHRKAMKLLNSTLNEKLLEATDCLPALYYNNLGCIHFHMRKHHLGAFDFRKAILENETMVKDFLKQKKVTEKNLSGRRLQTLGINRHYELLSNIGLQLLHCGKPQQAFECLLDVLQTCKTNARLWLRLAECCVMIHQENNDIDRSIERRLHVIKDSVGSGVHRKLVLGSGTHNRDPSPESASVPAATLEFASVCLRNALVLLPDDSTSMASTEESVDASKPQYDTVLVSAAPGNPMRGPEVQNLRCSVLANSSYVSLCLGDHVLALKYAENLLSQPRISPALKYLGNMYKAEALVASDKIADAVQHLNADVVTDISTAPPEVRQDLDKDRNGDRDSGESADASGSLYAWSPKDITKARAIMQYNLAVAYSIRGEFDKAMAFLTKSTQAIGIPLPAQVYYLRLYLDLLEGRRKIAQGIIKEHYGHMTPNRI